MATFLIVISALALVVVPASLDFIADVRKLWLQSSVQAQVEVPLSVAVSPQVESVVELPKVADISWVQSVVEIDEPQVDIFEFISSKVYEVETESLRSQVISIRKPVVQSVVDYSAMTVVKLKEVAKGLGIKVGKLRKAELIAAIQSAI